MKNIHASAFIRPLKIYKCLLALKAAGNPYYSNTITKCIFCDKEFDLDENILDHVEQCQLDFEEMDTAEHECDEGAALEISFQSITQF